MKKKKDYKLIIITQNKYIKYNYFIKKEFEAGLLLKGWEVKSLRKNKIIINNSYINIIKGEAFLLGSFLKPLYRDSLHFIYNPIRIRKLLLNKYEIDSLYGFVSCDGYTIIVMSIYWKNTLIKIKIGVVKGKKKIDKRINIKNREWCINKLRFIKKYKNYS